MVIQSEELQKLKEKFEAAENSFVNPYAFVSIDEKCHKEKMKLIPKAEALDGWIEAVIEPQTPLFIPDTSKEPEEDQQEYPFFSYHENGPNQTNRPAIPGSSLRGMLRSAHEAVTNSCLSAISNGTIYKRFVTPREKAGILVKENEGWVLYQAELAIVAFREVYYGENKGKDIDKAEFAEAARVFVEMEDDQKGQKRVVNIKTDNFANASAEEAYIHYSGLFLNKKQNQKVFLKKGIATDLNLEEAVGKFRKVLERYIVNKDTQIRKTYQRVLNVLDQENRALVYYSDDFKYFSPACISIEAFYNNINYILYQQGDHQPCVAKEALCETCRLFGMVGEKTSLGSRIRVTDAVIKEKDQLANPNDYYFKKMITLKELASPKIAATEFYLARQPESAVLWDYDKAYQGIKKEDRRLINDYQPRINGRKFYWHSLNDNYTTDQKNHRNYTVQLVKKSDPANKKPIRFTFRIFFEGITKEELEKLCWVLTIGDKPDHAHKIGRGKPLGLGSIQIRIGQVSLRRLEKTATHITYCLEDFPLNFQGTFNEEEKNIQEFLNITNTKLPKGAQVAYPLGEKAPNKNSPMYWFMQNRENSNSNKNKQFYPLISDTLPTINETASQAKVLTKKIKK